MPIYEFTCEMCGNEFEHLQSFSDNKIPHCPSCLSGHVTRRLGRPAIHFKGSGWYINDSKKSSERSSASGESKSSEVKNGETKSGEGKVEKPSGEGESKAVSKSDSKSETPAAASTPSTPD